MKTIKIIFFALFVFCSLGFAQSVDSTQIKKYQNDFTALSQKLESLEKQKIELNNQIEQIKGAMGYIQAQYAEEIKKIGRKK